MKIMRMQSMGPRYSLVTTTQSLRYSDRALVINTLSSSSSLSRSRSMSRSSSMFGHHHPVTPVQRSRPSNKYIVKLKLAVQVKLKVKEMVRVNFILNTPEHPTH